VPSSDGADSNQLQTTEVISEIEFEEKSLRVFEGMHVGLGLQDY
jgi:hypothetical protein